MNKKRIVFLVVAVLLLTTILSSAVSATVGESIDKFLTSPGRLWDSVRTKEGESKIPWYDDHRQAIDFAIFFLLFTSITTIGLKKWGKGVGEGGADNAVKALSVILGAAFGLAAVKAGMSVTFFVPFVRNLLFFIAFIIIFFLLLKVGVKNKIVAAIVALLVVWLLFNFVNGLTDSKVGFSFKDWVINVPTETESTVGYVSPGGGYIPPESTTPPGGAGVDEALKKSLTDAVGQDGAIFNADGSITLFFWDSSVTKPEQKGKPRNVMPSEISVSGNSLVVNRVIETKPVSANYLSGKTKGLNTATWYPVINSNNQQVVCEYYAQFANRSYIQYCTVGGLMADGIYGPITHEAVMNSAKKLWGKKKGNEKVVLSWLSKTGDFIFDSEAGNIVEMLAAEVRGELKGALKEKFDKEIAKEEEAKAQRTKDNIALFGGGSFLALILCLAAIGFLRSTKKGKKINKKVMQGEDIIKKIKELLQKKLRIINSTCSPKDIAAINNWIANLSKGLLKNSEFLKGYISSTVKAGTDLPHKNIDLLVKVEREIDEEIKRVKEFWGLIETEAQQINDIVKKAGVIDRKNAEDMCMEEVKLIELIEKLENEIWMILESKGEDELLQHIYKRITELGKKDKFEAKELEKLLVYILKHLIRLQRSPYPLKGNDITEFYAELNNALKNKIVFVKFKDAVVNFKIALFAGNELHLWQLDAEGKEISGSFRVKINVLEEELIRRIKEGILDINKQQRGAAQEQLVSTMKGVMQTKLEKYIEDKRRRTSKNVLQSLWRKKGYEGFQRYCMLDIVEDIARTGMSMKENKDAHMKLTQLYFEIVKSISAFLKEKRYSDGEVEKFFRCEKAVKQHFFPSKKEETGKRSILTKKESDRLLNQFPKKTRQRLI